MIILQVPSSVFSKNFGFKKAGIGQGLLSHAGGIGVRLPLCFTNRRIACCAMKFLFPFCSLRLLSAAILSRKDFRYWHVPQLLVILSRSWFMAVLPHTGIALSDSRSLFRVQFIDELRLVYT